MKIISPDELDSYVQSEEQISARLTTPLVLTFVDTDKINFERSRSGFWGWGGDKSETVSGYDTKVFGANNVELITRTRTEHLTEEDKKRAKSNKNPLQSFLGMAEVEVKQQAVESDTQSEFFSANNPCCISPAEYFDGETDLKTRDIGRPKEMTCKVQKFQPQLWLCEDYPLSLQEQVRDVMRSFWPIDFTPHRITFRFVAGDAHRGLDGHLQHALPKAEGLHHLQLPGRISSQNRDPAISRSERQGHIREHLRSGQQHTWHPR